ncbi:MAG: glycosyltransferase [PVC group bacterium]|nr:glycosyltransferase [PVC group bacterium]
MENGLKTIDLSLVVPVFNEEEIIEETIEIFLQDLSAVCEHYELIVVNDASSDRTQVVLDELALKYRDRLKVVKNEKNLGSGRSLVIGMRKAQFSLICTNFADRPFDLKELKCILPVFSTKDVDFMVICRLDRSANNLYRKLTSLINYYLIQLLFNTRVGDFQFVQIYRKEIIKSIRVESNRTFVAPEIIIKALAKGYKMVEYKSKFYSRTKGKAKCGHPKVILHALFDMFRFWFKVKIIRTII